MCTDMTEGPKFVAGLELARRFFHDAVFPILREWRPDLEYSAGLIGSGSEVLGFDDAMSTDHHWGPRVMLFLREPVFEGCGAELRGVLARRLPKSFMGYPTNWSAPDPDDNGVQTLAPAVDDDRINHRVELFTVRGFFDDYMGLDVTQPLSSADWLTLPWQKLRSVSAGDVFLDGVGLQEIRDTLRWYPHDVWLYLLGSCWARIGQEEHLMGRAGWAGDEVGSAIIAARLVRDVMRLAFLMECVYPPYAKWFGRAFVELPCGPQLHPLLLEIMNASSWQERNHGLAAAYSRLGQMHNGLAVTPPVPCQVSSFWERPFKVIWGQRFASALQQAMTDPHVRAISRGRLIGNIDLVTDNTDLLEDTARRTALVELYRQAVRSSGGSPGWFA